MKTRLAAKALIEKDGKYLVLTGRLLSSNNLYQDLPGGKIEFGETPEQTVFRESGEEINAQVKIEKFLGYYQFFTEDKNTHTTCLTFLCTLKKNKSQIEITNNPDLKEQIMSFEFLSKENLLKAMNNSSFSKLVENSL
jgi:8-oxo-dGTP diphosphatase